MSPSAPAASPTVAPPSASDAKDPPLDLVYIVGHHRSGGTVLSSLLSNHPSVFFAGEVYRFPFPIWEPGSRDRLCSCGRPTLDCPFWSSVRSAAESEPGFLTELRRGQIRYEQWSHFLGTLWRGWRREPNQERHVARMFHFLSLIQRSTGKPVLVETSYSALRAWLYRHRPPPGVRVRYIHFVRDGRSFLQSEASSPPDFESPWRWLREPPFILARWAVFNFFAVVLCGRDRSRYLRMRYEEFLQEPEAALSRIGAFLGLDLSGLAERAAQGGEFRLDHVTAANRLRTRGTFTLRQPSEAKFQISRADHVLFWLMDGSVALALGYRLRPRHSDRPVRTSP